MCAIYTLSRQDKVGGELKQTVTGFVATQKKTLDTQLVRGMWCARGHHCLKRRARGDGVEPSARALSNAHITSNIQHTPRAKAAPGPTVCVCGGGAR